MKTQFNLRMEEMIMKLLKSDIEYFKKCGYLDRDISQIEELIKLAEN